MTPALRENDRRTGLTARQFGYGSILCATVWNGTESRYSLGLLPFQAVPKCEGNRLLRIGAETRLTRLPAVVTRIESDGCFGGKPCHTAKIREESQSSRPCRSGGNRLLRIGPETRLTRLPAVVTRIESDGCFGGKPCHTRKTREEWRAPRVPDRAEVGESVSSG